MPELFTGTIIGGKYKVVKRLGRGGFGAVYLVEDTHLASERFALKIPHDHLIESDTLGRFRSEAQRLNRLSHPNIVGFRGFFEYPGERLAFFLLEYVDGPTLKDVLYPEGHTDDDGNSRRGQEIGVARALRITREVLQALDQAHRYVDPERGPTPIVHRDVKPENVLIAWPGAPHECAKVLDFGIARVVGGTRHTKTGAGFVGTGVYAPPEQAKGKKGEIDARVDVFACGTMLYEMLTGRLPFDAENEMGAIFQRQDHAAEKGTPVPSFAEKAPDRAFPPGVEEIARKAQEIDPAKRFASAREMIEAIEDLGIAGVVEGRRSAGAGGSGRAGAAGGAGGAGGERGKGDKERKGREEQQRAQRGAGGGGSGGSGRRGLVAGGVALAVVAALGVWAAMGGGGFGGGGAKGDASSSTGMSTSTGTSTGTGSSMSTSMSTGTGTGTGSSTPATTGANGPSPSPAHPERSDREAVAESKDPVRFLDLTPADGAWVREAHAEVKGRVDDATLRAIRVEGLLVKLGQGGAFSQSVSLREGPNEIALEASEGLRAAKHTVTLHLDTRAPALTLESPEAGAVTREGFVLVKGRASDPQLASVEVDGVAVRVDAEGRFEEKVGLSGEGPRAVPVIARDRAGNEARAEAKIVRDARAPEIEVTHPPDGTLTKAAGIDVTGRVRDASAVTLTLDGAPVRVAADGSFTAPWRLAEGEVEAVLVATDAAGHRTTVKRRATADRTAPRFTDVRVPASVKEGETLSVSGTLSERGCVVTVNGATARVEGTGFEAALAVPKGGPETIALALEAKDAAGNLGAERRSAKVERPSPPPPPVATTGWEGETLPKGMRRGKEKPVVLHDTGKGLEIEMVYVPAGGFVMGSDDGANDEKPKHTHPMPKGFFIGRTETTWAQYLAFCGATGRKAPDKPAWARDDHPVVNVDWSDADAYCRWIGGSLPSEAQWEKAARGTDGRKYPWGNPEPSAATCVFSGHPTYGGMSTAPVGSCPAGASPFGALDMAGNVWEWCDDWYDSGSYARYARGDTSPPSSASSRVYRGGSWSDGAGYCRSADRDRVGPSGRGGILGFRPARVTTE